MFHNICIVVKIVRNAELLNQIPIKIMYIYFCHCPVSVSSSSTTASLTTKLTSTDAGKCYRIQTAAIIYAISYDNR